MDARTGPKIRTGPDKLRGPDFSVRISLVRSVVRIFRSGFFWSGPWSGFSGPDFLGPVRGPDFSVRIFTGPVRGPDFLVRIIRTGPDFFVVRSVVRIFFFKIKKSGPDQIRLKNFGPVRISVRIFDQKKSGPDQFRLKTSVRSGYWYGFSK